MTAEKSLRHNGFCTHFVTVIFTVAVAVADCERHLRAKNTVFWPKITYDIQQLIEKCMICQKYGQSQPLIGTTQKLSPFPWHTLVTDLFYWKRMDFLIVPDVFSKYILVRKLPNSTYTAMCIELSMIVTELGLPHIIKSDNGPCYSSKEFQHFLQCYKQPKSSKV